MLKPSKNTTFIKQDNNNSTHAPKITKNDYIITFKESSHDIHNRIRALNPKTYGFINKTKVKFFDTYYSSNNDNLAIGEHKSQVYRSMIYE